MFKKGYCLIMILLGSGLFLSCSQGNKQTQPIEEIKPLEVEPPPSINREPVIKNLIVRVSEEFPAWASVVIDVELPDSCSVVDQYLVNQQERNFMIQLVTKQEGTHCKNTAKRYNSVIPLDIIGLKAGVYTVKVGTMEESFVLMVDNLLP